MDESEKMFHWGLGLTFAVLVLTAVLQVSYREQDKSRARTKSDIVKTQQQIAVASANFASLVRPEILRSMVVSIYPKVETISFNKQVSIDEL